MRFYRYFLIIGVLSLFAIFCRDGIASCPVTPTTVFFGNGVNTSEPDAQDTLDWILQPAILSELPAVYRTNDCVEFKLAYDSEFANKDGQIINGSSISQVLHAAGQIVEDIWDYSVDVIGDGVAKIWRWKWKVEDPPDAIVEAEAELIKSAVSIHAPNLQEHVNLYFEELKKGNNVIVVAHSQGNLYVNEAYEHLSGIEMARFHIVPVATPAAFVASGDQHFTLHDDIITTIPFHVPEYMNNSGPVSCNDSNEWSFSLSKHGTKCHSFLQSYMSVIFLNDEAYRIKDKGIYIDETGNTTRKAIVDAVVNFIKRDSPLSQFVAVPDVVGKARTEAESAITAAGLKVNVTTSNSSTVPLGHVISQNPAAGASVAAGTTVNLVVSSGVDTELPPTLTAPTNLAPGTNVGMPDTPPGPVLISNNVTFTWSAVSGATYYDIGIRDVTNGVEGPLFPIDRIVGKTSYPLLLDANHRYKWDVAACNAANECVRSGDMYFQTPTQAIYVSISPMEKTIEAGSVPVILTVTAVNTDITWPAPAGIAGAFTQNGNTITWNLPHIPGTYEFTVTAAADSSKKATARITVTEPQPELPNVTVAIANSHDHSLILKADGSVWGAGWNSHGQLGDGTTTDRHEFVKVIDSGATAIATGYQHSLVLKADGSVWAVGSNSYGQLGDGTTTDRHEFIKVIDSGVTAVDAGNYHSLVLKTDGSVWGAGNNRGSQLGDGTTTDRYEFTKVIDFGAVDISAGGHYSLALKSDGSVWATGENVFGELGVGGIRDRHEFIKVIDYGATALAAGYNHSLVLKVDGSVWATGRNNEGQFGDGTYIGHGTFIKVIDSGAVDISAGVAHSLVLKTDGSVWAAGRNIEGQFGDGTRISHNIFIKVIDSVATAVAAGVYHSFVLKTDDSVWAAGRNYYGQLGDGTTTYRYEFVKVID